jgi:hypothetical protein
MRLLVLMTLLSAVDLAHSQTIYTCRDVNGRTSYQTDPCAPGAKATAVKSYAPIHDDPHAAARLRQTEAIMNSRAIKPSYVNYGQINNAVTQPDSRAVQRAKCNAAKLNRDATLERVGLRRTHTLLRQLDADVNLACKGV